MAQMKPHTIVSKKPTITTRSGAQKQSINNDGMYINYTHTNTCIYSYTHKHVDIHTHETQRTHARMHAHTCCSLLAT